MALTWYNICNGAAMASAVPISCSFSLNENGNWYNDSIRRMTFSLSRQHTVNANPPCSESFKVQTGKISAHEVYTTHSSPYIVVARLQGVDIWRKIAIYWKVAIDNVKRANYSSAYITTVQHSQRRNHLSSKSYHILTHTKFPCLSEVTCMLLMLKCHSLLCQNHDRPTINWSVCLAWKNSTLLSLPWLRHRMLNLNI